jgi:L-lysine 2,3-aminomutase
MEAEQMMLALLAELVEGRNLFLTRGINRISTTHRDALTSRFFLNELCYLEIANRVFQNHVRTQSVNAAATLLTLNIPTNFMDPVAIRPTAEQITAATASVPQPLADTTCPICQDALTSNATRITHCNHTYHQTCLDSWFTMSVRCPVCRYDIRGGQATQTSPGA